MLTKAMLRRTNVQQNYLLRYLLLLGSFLDKAQENHTNPLVPKVVAEGSSITAKVLA